MKLKALALVLLLVGMVNAKNDFKEVKVTKKKDSFIFDHDANIHRTKNDHIIDEMIFDCLGEDYRRANVFDFFPLEISERMSHEDKVELMDYYDYARKELEHISRSKLIRYVKKDLNLDGKYDYAIVVYNEKKEKIYLAVIDKSKKHYLKEFKENFVELVNYGRYPTTIITKKNKNNIIKIDS